MSAAIPRLSLPGFDGSNPLGFLAALGTLAILSEGDATIRLGWQAAARWMPFLQSGQPLDGVSVAARLAEKLHGQRVDAGAERKREAAQKRFDAAKKKLKGVEAALRKLKLRGAEREAARKKEVEPLEQTQAVARDELLALLKQAVPSPELALGQRPDCTIAEFRQHATSMRTDGSPANRASMDLLASFGTELEDLPDQRIAPTPFCFITGSGHQWFLDTARQLMSRKQPTKQEPNPQPCVTPKSVRETLFVPWTYSDEGLSMRWDPAEDIRYALHLDDPGPVGAYTVWMANLLAYRALAFFPCAPGARGLVATGWTAGRESDRFTWPLWEPPLSADTIRSLLRHRAFGETDVATYRRELRARGVAAIFGARRIQVGNPPLHKINFSPADAL